MTVRITERDVAMLVKCALCRWLTTDQLRRLYFPTATPNAVQKRLRKLSEAGYLRTHQESPTAEAIHAVGPKGKPLVEEKGIAAMLGGEIPRQIEHLRGVNDIRIAIESGSEPIAYLFAYWQLPNLGWSYPMIPDTVLGVRAPGRRTFLVEYDRGTETLEKLALKFRWYETSFLRFPFEAVVFITERPRQTDLLLRELRRKEVSVSILSSSLESVLSRGFFEIEFTEVPGGGMRRVLAKVQEGAED
jgi:hypothetical protein